MDDKEIRKKYLALETRRAEALLVHRSRMERFLKEENRLAVELWHLFHPDIHIGDHTNFGVLKYYGIYEFSGEIFLHLTFSRNGTIVCLTWKAGLIDGKPVRKVTE